MGVSLVHRRAGAGPRSGHGWQGTMPLRAWGMRGRITCDVQRRRTRRWSHSSCPSSASSSKRGIASSTVLGIPDVLWVASGPFGVQYFAANADHLVQTVVTTDNHPSDIKSRMLKSVDHHLYRLEYESGGQGQWNVSECQRDRSARSWLSQVCNSLYCTFCQCIMVTRIPYTFQI